MILDEELHFASGRLIDLLPLHQRPHAHKEITSFFPHGERFLSGEGRQKTQAKVHGTALLRRGLRRFMHGSEEALLFSGDHGRHVPCASGNHQRPQQDEKRQHLERCPNGMPLFKSVQFGRQGHLIIRCVFDAEHHWGCPGRGEGVKDTQQ